LRGVAARAWNAKATSPSMSDAISCTLRLYQGPTKSPIVWLASDSRHWGFKNYAPKLER
jgi:hypothetical protein